ncbi:hypothetical protein F6X54_19000 [Micromonospora aurantiaca]|uniref:Secreted protein n=1 Tax=Micromonospora aurantiaca (nom. illeg.) TaxID=47850 RepID=A0A3M9KN20_9ACTN|nr:hypothetical protein DVH21_21420 [Micromonospora aurantiaca]KAB1109631.1 hypothetical protein F6X54_19000 [Micromonospora aurantiaca]RNI01523.1 hypothetical protein EEZ25_16030 [Micromonospora aurantiaca]
MRVGWPGAAKTGWRSRRALLACRWPCRRTREVVPVTAVSTWVLPSGVTAGRQVVRERRRTPERHDHAIRLRPAPRRRRPRT